MGMHFDVATVSTRPNKVFKADCFWAGLVFPISLLDAGPKATALTPTLGLSEFRPIWWAHLKGVAVEPENKAPFGNPKTTPPFLESNINGIHVDLHLTIAP